MTRCVRLVVRGIMQGAGAKTVRRSSLQGLGQKARLEAGGKVSEVLFPGAMGCINLSDRMASGDRAMLTPDRGSPRKRMQGGADFVGAPRLHERWVADGRCDLNWLGDESLLSR